MQLTALIFLTLDGVYQGPGGPDEDRRGGFERGGWLGRHADAESGAFIRSLYARADALLLGRVTYDIWAPYWPAQDDADLLARTIKALPKHVVSTTLRDPTWGPTRVIGDDVEAGIRSLKDGPGREVLVQGSGVLLRFLLERGLVDELNVLLAPTVLGAGLRLFPERGPAYDLGLVASRPTPSGSTILTFRPGGTVAAPGGDQSSRPSP